MLSDLFDEEEPVGSHNWRREVGLSSKPPLSRSEHNLVGLDNQGNTCYLNSLIQQLFFTPEFLEGLFAIGPDLLGVGGPEAMVRTIPLELQRLFARMLMVDEVAVSTSDLTRSFGWTGSEVFQQHDVQELNRILFTAIEDSLVGLEIGSDLIKKYYRGTLVNQVQCQSCKAVSEREEEYQDLCVPVAGHSDLTSALVTAYVGTERLEGDNAYRCAKCNAYVTASKGTKIRRLPPILTISMLRFNFDCKKMERYKETRRFEFPMTLDMSMFVENSPTQTAECPAESVYDLVGVVIHRGSTYGGHYHAYIRDNLLLGRWTAPETAPILVQDPIKADFLEAQTPLEMLCMILGRAGPDGMKVDNLGGEIVKQTGVSWNKRFRPGHGQLIKFIRRNDHIFAFNPDSRWVWLMEADKTVKEEGRPKEVEKERSPSSKSEDSEKISSERAESQAGEAGWFDFNDAHVSPIHPSKIESQFEGKESAYILTYRVRSLDMMRNGQLEITPPEWLVMEISKHNENLRKEREEYDSRIHRITINLLESRHVHLVRGNLEFVDDSDDEPRQLRIDCRKPLKELLDLIVTAPELSRVSLLWRGVEPAFYVKDELRESDPDRPINSLGISNGSRLLLWNGTEVNGVPWPHCRQRPFRLVLECPICSPDLTVRVHGCDTPLWLCICEQWPDLDPSGVRVSKVCTTQHGDECIIPLLSDDLHRTAEELGLSGDVHVVVDDIRTSSQRATVTSRPRKSNQTIRYHAAVKNCLTKEDNVPRLYVPLDPSATVLEFRMEALRSCGFSAVDVMAAETRLRLAPKGLDDPDDLGPPLIDEWTILESGWDMENNKAYFVLERGQPVTEGQLFLTILPWDMSAECSVVIPENVSVGSLKTSAAEALILKKDISPSDLLLQSVTWCGDSGTPYRDEERSLVEAGIRHGDRLLLQRGSLPPRGQAAVPVRWRCVPTEGLLCTATAQRLLSGDSLVDRLAEGLRSMWTAQARAREGADGGEAEAPVETCGRLLTRMTVDQTTTMAELRTMVVARLQEGNGEEGAEEVPPELLPIDPECVRLRVVERGACAAVLKSPNQTVQRARISDTRPLCVDLLPVPVSMDSGDVLLMVRVLDDALRSYSPPYEVVWRSQEGAPPSALYAQLDSLFSLGTDHFRLAKQLPERRQWMPIPAEDSAATGGAADKKKRPAPALKRVSLLKAPYGLRDGDTVGLKRISPGTAVTGEDFASADDLAARQKMEEELLARKKNRGSAGGVCATGGVGGGAGAVRYRPQEAPLVIHVKRFT